MWYAKMYFSGEKEFFENDAFGMQGVPSKQLELPFLESLLTFLELDEKEITPMLERISVNWERFVESRDREAYTAAMVELGVLAEKHIYLRLLYTRSFGCFSVNGYDQAEIQAIALDLKEFVTQFSETRKQVEKFLECVLDVDSAGRVSAEYCERPVKYGEQRCREIGAFRQWTKRQTDDPIFKAYRKEYKKRFAWIKAGRITDEQFYAWSEKAREEKKKCDREIISLEDFQQWLRDSKI